MSHLHYPSIVLSSLISSLKKSLKKQLSWAIKTCCDRKKFDSSSDHELECKVLPVSLFLDWKKICYLWKVKHKLLTANTKIEYEINLIGESKRTKKLHFQARFINHSIHNRFFFQKSIFYLKTNSKCKFNQKQQQFN